MLGRLKLRGVGQTVEHFRTRKTALLLAYLACHRFYPHHRDRLIEHCWPDCSPEAGRNRLRVELSWLRQCLEGDRGAGDGLKGQILWTEGDTVQLNPGWMSTDVEAFEQAVGLGVGLGSGDVRQRREELQGAIALYQGDFMLGEDDLWADQERHRLRDLYGGALAELSGCLVELGDWQTALTYAHKAIALDSCCELAYQQVIRSYLALHRPRAAHEAYRTLVRHLKQELNCGPSEVTRRLLDALKN